MGFAPLCIVAGDGMSVVDKFYSGYGDQLTSQQDRLVTEGNKFLREKYKAVDFIKTARVAGDKKDEEKTDDKEKKKDDKKKDDKGAAPPKATAKPTATP